MIVTVAEFQTNPNRYLSIAEREDVTITSDRRNVAEESGVSVDRMNFLRTIRGIVPENVSLDEARNERLRKHESRH